MSEHDIPESPHDPQAPEAHKTFECRPETCGGVDYDPCPKALP